MAGSFSLRPTLPTSVPAVHMIKFKLLPSPLLNLRPLP